jgi:predicted ABC-type ATPase
MKWLCNNCGYVYNINLYGYDISKIKNNLGIKHIFPICCKCNSSVKLIYQNNNIYEILILNGTGGSGKTTVSKHMYSENDCFIIDGDIVLEMVREKTPEGIVYNSNEVYNEFIDEILIGIAFNKKVILNHIFSKEDYQRFYKKLQEKNVKPIMVILRPDIEIAINRAQGRTTYIKNRKTPTQRSTIEKFYQMMMKYDKDEYLVIDNSNLSIKETVEYIKKQKNCT